MEVLNVITILYCTVIKGFISDAKEIFELVFSKVLPL